MPADATSGPSIFALPGRLGDVEALPRAEWPSARRFREYYAPPCGSRVDAAAGIPVVLLGAAAEMPASSRWTDEAFAARDSPYAVTLDNVELAKTETRAAGEAKPLRHDVWLPPPLACGSGTQRLAEAILWFSSGGAQPVAHADGDSEDNFLCVFDGSKRLALWHPRHGGAIESAELGWHNTSRGDATYGGVRSVLAGSAFAGALLPLADLEEAGWPAAATLGAVLAPLALLLLRRRTSRASGRSPSEGLRAEASVGFALGGGGTALQLWAQLEAAMPARLYTKLRYAKLRGGLHAHAPPPVCDGAAGGGKAHWRQLNGSWRRADGTLCVAALTTMDALLRNADTVANRELVLRGLWAVAAATSLVSTAELIGAMVDAGDAHPSLRSELLRLGLPLAELLLHEPWGDDLSAPRARLSPPLLALLGRHRIAPGLDSPVRLLAPPSTLSPRGWLALAGLWARVASGWARSPAATRDEPPVEPALSLETRELFGSPVGLAEVRDASLLLDLRRLAAALHERASRQRASKKLNNLTNDEFFQAQMRNQRSIARQALLREGSQAEGVAEGVAQSEVDVWAAVLTGGERHGTHVHEGSGFSRVLHEPLIDSSRIGSAPFFQGQGGGGKWEEL
ncbi:hypothetical protein EMIHUDRAFT_201165 [Emiliania huxleyi CCMP1516]|uniref:Anaphase-promoting complex subunit 1 n=2 Tax=Emiliania huxleyi TaxID=2903 RepID=A0A0D3KM99_EMIH1|nr:hypothetical protein EMIHUDRAFT_201165 [Emiliania huxleyi CCMP1516]EOD36884.1 hypothetical protein EMIHUDRAFT_201165 [Emiliania huxleyi CCMP1516]|eukprot:XP_005789313.1 hypothetical protein EMIHUDRAFT_201165 [Emiliania huxleyi CCMP1516]